MKETTWIVDPHTGVLTVEGLSQVELNTIAADLLPAGKQVNCAHPIGIRPFSNSAVRNTLSIPSLRVFRIYHNSVVEGPGRRSVAQLSGCKKFCTRFIYSLKWANYDAAHERHKHRTKYTSPFVLV